MIFNSEYVFNNCKLDEIGSIIENIRLEHDQKYGENYCRRIEVTCIAKFLDKIKRKQKILRSSVITCLEE